MRLSLENVSVSFEGVTALSDVSLEIEPGQLVAVIGPSGAGKTTLFRVATRSVIVSGRVLLSGEDLYGMSRRRLRESRRQVGTIRQGYDLVPQLSAGMNVALGEVSGRGNLSSIGAFLKGPERDVAVRVEMALARVGMEGRSGTMFSSLSGGQRQRVAVARLLVQRPSLVLADEPVAAVDPVTATRVLESLCELNDDGATVVVNLHDVGLARRFPRVVALKRGRVVFDGDPSLLSDGDLRDIYSGDVDERDRVHARPLHANRIVGGMDGISSH